MYVTTVTNTMDNLICQNGMWYVHFGHEEIGKDSGVYKCIEYQASRKKPDVDKINSYILKHNETYGTHYPTYLASDFE